MASLSDLQNAVAGARRLGEADPVITGLAYDSRKVQPGDLFFAVTGLKSDGHAFLPDVIARGAAAAVVEREVEGVQIPALLVENARAAMPRLAAAFHDYPSRKLSLVGVTGTNGKTTTTFLVEAIARGAGVGTGVIGTLGARINDEEIPGDRTTPESPDLQALLARMLEASGEGQGRPVVAMEVSSHALVQGRTDGCEYDVAVFTNLTQDHLDYHQDMESYFAAKALLFTEYPKATAKPFTAVINVDDHYGRRLARMSGGTVFTYAVEAEADLRATGIEASATGLRFTVETAEGAFPVKLHLGGLFNVYNSLGAMGAGRALGFDWPTIIDALQASPGVPGRFESVAAGQDFGVIVDYAHTPDGLENVLKAARALDPKRLITVFGCGGDRDRTKRPIMGRIAAELSDAVIVTSDNPRTEDPESILEQIIEGIPTGSADVERDVDRRAAINLAIQSAAEGDLVVIAGKGHENYQIFADGSIHFDDREEARKALNARLSA